jgi:arylsulfatase A-like enzyme
MATSGHPNILFLFPDQHRYDWVGWNPDLSVRTPNLDRLAARGVTFNRHICNSPLCAPSRATLALGVSYRRCGVIDNLDDTPLDRPYVYQHLRDAGYRTAAVGKVDLHKGTFEWKLDGSSWLDKWGFTDGIDNEGKHAGAVTGVKEPAGPYMAFLHDRGLAQIHHDDLHDRHDFTSTYPTPLPDDAYSDNWIAENCLRYLREFPTDQPWFIQVNYTGPHEPMDITQSMHDRWTDVDFPGPIDSDEFDPETHLQIRRNYAAMLENIDRHTARYLEVIEERGELDNTIVVYSSDHGEMLGDHNQWAKWTYRQPSLGVPLVIAGPGVQSGRSTDAIVQLIDLPATFIDYAGAKPLPDADGKSLRPLLDGSADILHDHVFAGQTNRVEHPTGAGGDGGLLDYMMVTSKAFDWDLVSDGRFKLVRDRHASRTLLFDLDNDPLEQVDLSDSRPDMVKTLDAVLDRELERPIPKGTA